MSRFSIEQFIRSTAQQDRGEGLFELESDRMLEANLDGDLWIKTGSMTAYIGNVQFSRERILEKGIGKMLKKAVTGEGAKLTRASGQGRMYLADMGKSIQILNLDEDGRHEVHRPDRALQCQSKVQLRRVHVGRTPAFRPCRLLDRDRGKRARAHEDGPSE